MECGARGAFPMYDSNKEVELACSAVEQQLL